MVDRDFINLQQALAGEYSLERELGRGGMGIVYLAREVQLDRLVAIKVLPEALAALPEVRERFAREARIAASLSHPHIVPIYRVGEAKGCVFFVMAYVNGETLGDRLRARGPLSASAAARLLREVTWALSYAHGRGIVHRDIKPDNILIETETGRALVSDFGIARRATEIQLAADPARIMGTAEFMSPEQAAGEPLDGRSDLYSLGVVGHLALSGALPSGAQASGTTPATVPCGLAGVLERCLRANPAERFATGEELAEALEGALSPERAKLPMPLRLWAQAQDPLAPVYAWWSASWTMMLIAEASRVARFPALALVPLLSLVPLTIFHARKTYHALAAGYSMRDLRAALATWQRERREELTFELDRAESRWARALRVLTYASAGGVVYAFVHGVPYSLFSKIIIAGSLVGSVGGFMLSHVLGVPLVSRRIRTKLVGAVRSLIWNSRVGEWAAKVLTPETRTRIADLDYRPTEFALGVAVEELFATLPAAYRENLSELPAVVARLEAHAAAARAHVNELNDLLSLARDPSLAAEAQDLTRARDVAKRELADSVVALEGVRVDLLRLHGGAADLRPITSALAAARALSEQLGRLARARDEVEQISPAFPIDLRPHTPV